MDEKERKILVNNMLFKADRFSHTNFLNETELSVCLDELKYHENYIITGGTETCERNIIIFHSEFVEKEDIYNPIKALQIIHKNKFSHRDVLGSIMGLGIKREKVGDIFTSDDITFFFVLEEIFEFILQNLLKIGRECVIVKEIPLEKAFKQESDFTVIKDTVKSLRLDSVVSSGYKISRNLACDYINSQKVFLNNKICTKTSFKINENDKISIRGKGKIVFCGEKGQSKKERIFIEIKRFK